MSANEYNPFKVAQAQIDEACAMLGLDEGTHQMLRNPMREYHFTIPVKMDDGKVKVFQGFRVQYNDARGPNKGGIRFHPAETIDTVRALAAWMTWKTSVVDIPLGGGKGGVICNPKEMSEGELERLSRGWMRVMAYNLGSKKDVPAPDVYTTGQIMCWMMDEYETIKGHAEPGVITGKPLGNGGSAGRGDATARGGVYCAREAAKKLGIDLKGATVAIQGFGNAGQFAATLMESVNGSKIVAACDTKATVYNPDGIDAQDLVDYKLANKSLKGYPKAKEITQAEMFALDVDILIPAALENSITADNAASVKAKMILELANGPTTPEADAILDSKGVFVIPDFLCNAGGVTVSYFENVQNEYNYYWTEAEVQERLDIKMTAAFNAVYDMHIAKNVNMRKAAYLVSVKRVADAMKLRGWV